MYRVINSTAQDILYGDQKVVPNEQLIVMNKIADAKTFKVGEATCDIISLCGDHAANCKGNIACLPHEGGDGTIFEIKERN